MGEKEQAPYLWKQRAAPCSVYPSPEGVRETLAQSETHEKTAQSPNWSLKDDWNNGIWLIHTAPLWGCGSGGKQTRGSSEHRESCPNVQKKIEWLPTIINTRSSSGVIRMGVCVGTPGHFQSQLPWEPNPGALPLRGQSLLQYGPLQTGQGVRGNLDTWGQSHLRCPSFPQ